MMTSIESKLPTIVYINPSQPEQNHAYPIYVMYPSTITTIKEISCGYNFTLLLDTNLKLYSCGSNQYGQLGYDSEGAPVSQIRAVYFSKSFVPEGIRCGFTHAVVFNQRECYGWGEHQFGALGYEPIQVINSWMPRKLPILVSSHQKLLQVSCGNNTTIFNISHKFYCLGDNRVGQLGLILKKPSFEPQKIQIETNNKHPKSKLISVKAGDGFTIGMDDNYQLFGAGQVGKLGLAIRNKNMLPTGLSQLELNTNNRYEILTNVEEYDCRSNLVVKFKGDDHHYAVFGVNCNQDKVLEEYAKIVDQTKQFILLQQEQKLYKWLISANNKSNELQNLNLFTEKQIKIDRIGCEQCGRIIAVDNSPQQSNQSRYNWMKESQISRNNQEQSHHKAIPTLCNSSENVKIQNLEKQVKQQKQIIRLFQQYVSKLQNQNQDLKQQLRRSSVYCQEQKDDNVTNGLTLLKIVLKDMLQEHTRRGDK